MIKTLICFHFVFRDLGSNELTALHRDTFRDLMNLRDL